jgi:flagellar biosynthesis protein FliR
VREKGVGAVLLRGFLLGFCVGLCASILDFRGDIIDWSTGREEFCCPVFFAATKQALRYVGKLNSV